MRRSEGTRHCSMKMEEDQLHSRKKMKQETKKKENTKYRSGGWGEEQEITS